MKRLTKAKRLIALNLVVILLLSCFPMGARATISGVEFPVTLEAGWDVTQPFWVEEAGVYTFRVKSSSELRMDELRILDAQENEIVPLEEINNGAAFTTDIRFALAAGQHWFASAPASAGFAIPASLCLWLWEDDDTPPTNNPWGVSVARGRPIGNSDFWNGVGGGSASNIRPVPGEQVTLSAQPSHGFEFVRWNVVSGGVTLDNVNAPNATFTMPNNDVFLEPIFRLQTDAAWVTFRANDSGLGWLDEETGHGGQTVAVVGTRMPLRADPALLLVWDETSNEWNMVSIGEFVRWEVRSGDVRIEDPFSIDTYFVMQSATANVEIWAMFTPSGVPLPDTPITSVAIAPANNFQLAVGAARQLTANVLPAYANNQNVTWSSSNTAVARVDAAGRVTGVAPGTATITVRTEIGNRVASVTVTVPTSVNQGPIQALIAQKLALEGTAYTNETWRTFVQALEEAEAVSANQNATQAEIDAAYTALRTAANELVTIASFENPFADVTESNWFFEYIMYVYANGLMTGTAETTFAPNATLSRGMVVTVLYRMEGEPDVEFEPTFSDVPAGRWYSEAVIWAYQNEIVQGIGGDRFAPSVNITREQLATMLHRYAGFKEYDRDIPDTASLDAFTDHARTSTWAYDALRWAVYHELVRGSDDQLMPDGTATRAQYATILQRLIDRFEFGR
ncbi:MAG: S-layer homology domain-containing protein [Oscillospiraceae bacterium]|nr:S-layer homology domain-containing protein [Oscillospiraceae bacterium]